MGMQPNNNETEDWHKEHKESDGVWSNPATTAWSSEAEEQEGWPTDAWDGEVSKTLPNLLWSSRAKGGKQIQQIADTIGAWDGGAWDAGSKGKAQKGNTAWDGGAWDGGTWD